LFYSRVNDTGSQFHDWLVKDVNPEMKVQFRTAAEEFRLIKDDEQRTVIVQYKGNEEALRRLRAVGPKREIMRHLQRYSVHLPVRLVEKMKRDGMLDEVHDGILVQAWASMYKKDIGLDVFTERLPIEELIVDNPNQNTTR
jgi:CRISPR-associated endonuclease/helicase Cas3